MSKKSSFFRFFCLWVVDHLKNPLKAFVSTALFMMLCFGASIMTEKIFKPEKSTSEVENVSELDRDSDLTQASRSLASIDDHSRLPEIKRRRSSKGHSEDAPLEEKTLAPPHSSDSSSGVSAPSSFGNTSYANYGVVGDGDPIGSKSEASSQSHRSSDATGGMAISPLGVVPASTVGSGSVRNSGGGGRSDFNSSPGNAITLGASVGFQITAGGGFYQFPTFQMRGSMGEAVSYTPSNASGNPILIGGIEGSYYRR